MSRHPCWSWAPDAAHSHHLLPSRFLSPGYNLCSHGRIRAGFLASWRFFPFTYTPPYRLVFFPDATVSEVLLWVWWQWQELISFHEKNQQLGPNKSWKVTCYLNITVEKKSTHSNIDGWWRKEREREGRREAGREEGNKKEKKKKDWLVLGMINVS